MDLTILAITKVEPHSIPFILEMQAIIASMDGQMLIATDGSEAYSRAEKTFRYSRCIPVASAGYLESVHDYALSFVDTPYVLRLDDDEKCSLAMVEWLHARAYRAHDHWKFSRANLWTPQTYIKSPQLWPDHQTRLSVKAKAGGRTSVHAGSPFGGGALAPCAIEHYKFVVKTQVQRQAIADAYDRICAGYGSNGMLAFSLPELAYGDKIPLAPWGDGSVCD